MRRRASVRRGQARDQGSGRADRSWCTSPSTSPRARRSRSATSSSSATRRSATARSPGEMKENKGHGHLLVHHRRAAPTRKTSSTRTPSTIIEYYRDHGYIAAQVGQPRSEGARGLGGRQDPLGRSCSVPVTEGQALQGRRVQLRGQHGRQDRGAAAAVQDRAGRVLQREEDPEGPREGAGGLRRRRLLRVHRLSRSEAPRRSRIRPSHRRRPAPAAPAAAEAARAGPPSST